MDNYPTYYKHIKLILIIIYLLNPFGCIFLVYSDDFNKVIRSSILDMVSVAVLLNEPSL